jgi:glycosyltransferase involved in cell wall biosynthesis
MLRSSITRPETPPRTPTLHATPAIPEAAIDAVSGGLISVIIPTFNRAAFVTDALNSIAAQTWSALEIVVVDDGSTDCTAGVVDAWARSHPGLDVRLLRQPNRGVSAARNTGSAAARGAFLYFLDSDDLIHPHALETLVRPLLESDAPFSLAHIRNVDLAGKPTGDQSEGISRQSDNLFASHWMTHAALYRRSTLAAAGAFDEQLRRAEDTQHQWRVAAVAGRGLVIDRYIGQRRIHDRGHLCVGRTSSEGARDDLAAVRHFLEWADAGPLKATAAQAPRLRLIIAAVRAGANRDWGVHSEALSLLRRFGGMQTKTCQIALDVLGWRSPLIHAPLMFAVEVAKWVRERLHPVRSKTREIMDL